MTTFDELKENSSPGHIPEKEKDNKTFDATTEREPI